MQDFLNEEIYAGIWFWDLLQRNHIWLSPTLNKLLGFEKDSQPVIPHSWNELIPKDYIDNLVNFWIKTHPGQGFTVEEFNLEPRA
jgi:hypothetical protein